ncbi:site-specific integrase [Sphingobacterium hungaricum]|uniref:Core-binding (CB) domain-containing protein n=1 Tax=Sphingobacterium hungaricum TaxID=2082723 RepID=A0A928YPT3_9SPHI|nr:site-specific integrase [Sphingobacterium hungaricum]MBE8712887.1 hypothetical protein [Sphingobacterium hungaricum]
MAKVTPKLEQRKDPKTGQLRKDNVPVLLDVVFKGNRLWLQTGIKTNRSFWDPKNNRIKTSVSNSLELNGIIQIKVNEVEKIIFDAQLNGIELSVAFIRNSINKIKTSSNKTFWEYYDEYIKNVEMKCALNTLKKHKTSIELLKAYSKYSGLKFEFDVIDTDFYQKFVDFLMNKKNHSNVTIAKYTQTLKQFLNYSSIRGYNKNMVYKTFTFSSKEPEIIALKKEEILAIKSLELKNDVALDQVRDCLLFLCFTGLRYSDAANLKKSNVVNGFLEYVSIKTKTHVVIFPKISYDYKCSF